MDENVGGSRRNLDKNVGDAKRTTVFGLNSEDASRRNLESSPEPRKTSKYYRRREAKENSDFKEYCASAKSHIVTTRFNNNTWVENEAYRTQYPVLKCVYATPELNSERFLPDGVLFVLEMNNDTNRLMGIGMVRNRAIVKKHRVYSNENYNRYAYVGKHRIDRKDMTAEEEVVARVFDVLCFTGARHMKRLQGIKAFPMDMLYKCKSIMDLVEFVKTMFRRRMDKTAVLDENVGEA